MRRDAHHAPREAGRAGRLTASRTSSRSSSLVSTGRSCSRPPGCWHCRRAPLQGSRCHSMRPPHSGTLQPNMLSKLTLTAHFRAFSKAGQEICSQNIPKAFSGALNRRSACTGGLC